METTDRRKSSDNLEEIPTLSLSSLAHGPASSPRTSFQEPFPVHFQVRGLTDPHSAVAVERLLQTFPGVQHVRVDRETGKGEMHCVRVPPLLVVQQALRAHGYSILPHHEIPPLIPFSSIRHPPSAARDVLFQIQGIRSARCVTLIEDRLKRLEGVRQVRVDGRTGRGSLLCASLPPWQEAQKTLQAQGYTLLPWPEVDGSTSRILPARQEMSRNVLSLGIKTISPGWFTSVMGTGILAICLMLSPVSLPCFPTIALGLWVGDVLLFAFLLLLLFFQGLLFPSHLRVSIQNAAYAQGWGAPPIACFALATGFLLIGSHYLDPILALSCAQVLWVLGVAGGLLSALLVPYVMMTRHELTPDSTSGSWLLPVTPPIVASVPGALLVTHWPMELRSDMLVLSYALWGTGMILASLLIAAFYARLLYYKIPAGPLVPTLWMVVGPLGQSIAGFNALGTVAPTLWPTIGPVLRAAALVYGLPVWGFGMYWLALALFATVRATTRSLPFSLGWWAFVFPLGVLTAGTYALYGRTHTPLFAGAGVLLLGLLSFMWTLVATRTLGHLGKALRQTTHEDEAGSRDRAPASVFQVERPQQCVAASFPMCPQHMLRSTSGADTTRQAPKTRPDKRLPRAFPRSSHS